MVYKGSTTKMYDLAVLVSNWDSRPKNIFKNFIAIII
jgi:hypothetical protein